MIIGFRQRFVNHKIDEKDHFPAEKASDSNLGSGKDGTKSALSITEINPFYRSERYWSDFFDGKYPVENLTFDERYLIHVNASCQNNAGVKGENPPSDVHTLRNRSERVESLQVKRVPEKNSLAKQRYLRTHKNKLPKKQKKQWKTRWSNRCFPPQLLGWRASVGWASNALSRYSSLLAQNFRPCARAALSADCPQCGEIDSRIIVLASCDLRICAWCGRRRSKELQKDLYYRCLQVPEKTKEKALRVAAKLFHEANEHEAHMWGFVEKKQLGRVKRSRAAMERKRIDAKNVLGNAHWEWKELVIGQEWEPMNPEDWTRQGLTRRINLVIKQLERFWELCNFSGCATAISNIEISVAGHIHAHVLYYGPFLDMDWLNRGLEDIERAGKITVGSLRKPRKKLKKTDNYLLEALKETIKYCVKGPSPLDWQWIKGDPRPVLHPEIQALWVIVTKDLQLIRRSGVIRETQEEPPEDEKPIKCNSCQYEFQCTEHGLFDSAYNKYKDYKTKDLARIVQKTWYSKVAIRAP